MQRQIKKFDDDGSGTLDLEEFEACVRVRVRVRARVRVRIRVRVRLGLELGSGSGLANHDSKPNPNPNQAFVDSILSADEDPAALSILAAFEHMQCMTGVRLGPGLGLGLELAG